MLNVSNENLRDNQNLTEDNPNENIFKKGSRKIARPPTSTLILTLTLNQTLTLTGANFPRGQFSLHLQQVTAGCVL